MNHVTVNDIRKTHRTDEKALAKCVILRATEESRYQQKSIELFLLKNLWNVGADGKFQLESHYSTCPYSTFSE